MPIGAYYLVAAVLFATGLAGVLIRRNLIVLFMCVELMLNAVNLSLVAAARMWGGPEGQVFVFFVIVVAAAEVVVGLALIVNIFFRRGTLDVDAQHLLRH
ncbi:NADH-quinone oxidoreductase subunit NuoK [Salsipaludibacter albus]|uniref:NADH-quinone oxidoreductase subunit NuoK n=1 Tax=Salsipaludibacter albus TaxID=2849650 RepID=UPI001EE4D76C|nr:NADH-quinone oxidoreductase subunit NuoK [Salsipaludibacter albus]MBY5161049.1 NADH-quinone oxidoreductase subunit NuoK [Salsipaludibacter albus]